MNGDVSRSRAPLFEEDDLDLSGFAPRTPSLGERAEQVRAVAEPAAFRSREPASSPEVAAMPVPREPRRYRTGRNMQLNIKVREATATAFYAIADAHGWVLGETFERALAALKRELTEKS